MEAKIEQIIQELRIDSSLSALIQGMDKTQAQTYLKDFDAKKFINEMNLKLFPSPEQIKSLVKDSLAYDLAHLTEGEKNVFMEQLQISIKAFTPEVLEKIE